MQSLVPTSISGSIILALDLSLTSKEGRQTKKCKHEKRILYEFSKDTHKKEKVSN